MWLLLLPVAAAMPSKNHLGCTAIAADGAATVDGAAYAGMNTDCSDCDPRMAYIPARDYPEGANRTVYSNSGRYPRFQGSRAAIYNTTDRETTTTAIGSIPEVRHTFAYYESTLPLMNEVGLGLGEASCASRLMAKNPFEGGTALFDIAELMKVALERCATARCAVELLGDLVDKYGFYPMIGEATVGEEKGKPAYDDAGEALMISDTSGEAWVFHVTDGVEGVGRAAWVAQRVPKGHVAVCPNNFIIEEVPAESTEDFYVGKSLHAIAKAAGLWDGQGKLNFNKAFSPDMLVFGSPVGSIPIPLYGALRHWGVFNTIAPSLNLKLTMDASTYGFSIKPDKLLSHRDIMSLFKVTYEGTEFDLHHGVLAGPFQTPFRHEGHSDFGQIPRGISIQRTSYSTMAQSRTNDTRTLSTLWFASDTPLTSVYVPFYPAAGEHVADQYTFGNLWKFDRQSAWWAFNFVNNWMQLAYKPMSADVYSKIEAWDTAIDVDRKSLEVNSTLEELGAWQKRTQAAVVQSWWELADLLVMKYSDGYINLPKLGRTNQYPDWYQQMIGFNNDIHPVWVQPAVAPNPSPPGYPEPVVTLPGTWDFASETWILKDLVSLATVGAPSISVWNIVCYGAIFAVGFVVGQRRYRGYLTEPLLRH